MNAPTHIRFTKDEADAIDAYAEAHGLKKASAVRALLQLGIEAAAGSGAGSPDGAALARIEAAIGTLAERLDAANRTAEDARAALLARIERLEAGPVGGGER